MVKVSMEVLLFIIIANWELKGGERFDYVG